MNNHTKIVYIKASKLSTMVIWEGRERVYRNENSESIFGYIISGAASLLNESRLFWHCAIAGEAGIEAMITYLDWQIVVALSSLGPSPSFEVEQQEALLARGPASPPSS